MKNIFSFTGQDLELSKVRSWRIIKVIFVSILSLAFLFFLIFAAQNAEHGNCYESIGNLKKLCLGESRFHFEEFIPKSLIAFSIFILAVIIGTRLVRGLFRYIAYGENYQPKNQSDEK